MEVGRLFWGSMEELIPSCLPFFLAKNLRLLFVHGFAVSARPTHPPFARCARPRVSPSNPLRQEESLASLP